MSRARGRLLGLGKRGAALALAGLGAAVLALNLALGELRPESWWGMGYGIGAAVLALAGTAYGVRKRAPRAASRWRAGGAAAWLDLHLWGGFVFLFLVLAHSAFQVPTGAVTWWLWAASLWIVAGGLAGRLLQRWIPRILSSGLSVEVLYERIPELVGELGKRARALAEASPAPVRDLYARRVEPELRAPRRRPIFFFDITGGIHRKLREFEFLRGFLGGEERDRLAELERIYRSKLELDAHYTLQQALRVWLWLHTPVALVLLALLALHLVAVFLY